MAKKMKIEQERLIYHYDDKYGSFFVDDDMPFDSKIHPRLRHLHKHASFLICSKCGCKSWSDQINSECNSPQPDGVKCTGLYLGNRVFK